MMTSENSEKDRYNHLLKLLTERSDEENSKRTFNLFQMIYAISNVANARPKDRANLVHPIMESAAEHLKTTSKGQGSSTHPLIGDIKSTSSGFRLADWTGRQLSDELNKLKSELSVNNRNEATFRLSWKNMSSVNSVRDRVRSQLNGSKPSAPFESRPTPSSSLMKRKKIETIEPQTNISSNNNNSNNNNNKRNGPMAFKSARTELISQQKQTGNRSRVGLARPSARTPSSEFVPPFRKQKEGAGQNELVGAGGLAAIDESIDMTDPRLQSVDPKLVETILREVRNNVDNISWNRIAGLGFAKDAIKEIVVFPLLRPDLFSGIRGPAKGLLLFGPPGTGKTMIGKCVASQANATFFSISASSLMSKWMGESERLVRALFTVARVCQPSVIFIDEVDSLLSQRSATENECGRRVKNEFFVQMDGVNSQPNDRVLVIGATNRPQELDEAARRRFTKRLYIPLPSSAARRHIVNTLLSELTHSLSEQDFDYIVSRSKGFSGADMDTLCRESALAPLRQHLSHIEDVRADQVAPIRLCDFESGFKLVRPSVSQSEIDQYWEWNVEFGSWQIDPLNLD